MRFTNCSLYSAAIECYPGINPEKMLLCKTKSNILVLAFYSPLLTFYSVAALDSALGVGMGSKPAFRRCAQVEHLLQQEMRRLYNIRKAEEEWDRWFHAWSTVNPWPEFSSQGRSYWKQRNGNLVWRGGGRDFPHCMKCPFRAARLQRKDLSSQGRCRC